LIASAAVATAGKTSCTSWVSAGTSVPARAFWIVTPTRPNRHHDAGYHLVDPLHRQVNRDHSGAALDRQERGQLVGQGGLVLVPEMVEQDSSGHGIASIRGFNEGEFPAVSFRGHGVGSGVRCQPTGIPFASQRVKCRRSASVGRRTWRFPSSRGDGARASAE
jgi:hypothetical protein